MSATAEQTIFDCSAVVVFTSLNLNRFLFHRETLASLKCKKHTREPLLKLVGVLACLSIGHIASFLQDVPLRTRPSAASFLFAQTNYLLLCNFTDAT